MWEVFFEEVLWTELDVLAGHVVERLRGKGWGLPYSSSNLEEKAGTPRERWCIKTEARPGTSVVAAEKVSLRVKDLLWARLPSPLRAPVPDHLQLLNLGFVEGRLLGTTDYSCIKIPCPNGCSSLRFFCVWTWTVFWCQRPCLNQDVLVEYPRTWG